MCEYLLLNSTQQIEMNYYLSYFGIGAYHTGVEVYGKGKME
jgi:hypothetical protein